MRLVTSKPSSTEHPKSTEPLKALITVDELVGYVKEGGHQFDRLYLYLLVWIGLVPPPIRGLPLNTYEGVYSPLVAKRVIRILDAKDRTVSSLRATLPTYEYEPASDHVVSGEAFIQLETPQFARDVPEPLRVLLKDVFFTAHSAGRAFIKLEQDFVSQFYFPNDLTGHLVKTIVQHDRPLLSSSSEDSYALARDLTRLLGGVEERTVSWILQTVEQAMKDAWRVRADFVTWYECIDGDKLATAQAIRSELQEGSTLQSRIAVVALLSKKKIITKILLFTTHFLFSLVMLGLFVISSYSQKLRPHSVDPAAAALSFAVMGFWVLARDFSSITRPAAVRPSPLHYVDSMMGLAICFAMAYEQIALMGGMSTSGPSGPFDFLYFSVVTMTTTGYGDITPVSWAARLLTMLQLGIGLSYTLVVFGIIVSRLSAKGEDVSKA